MPILHQCGELPVPLPRTRLTRAFARRHCMRRAFPGRASAHGLRDAGTVVSGSNLFLIYYYISYCYENRRYGIVLRLGVPLKPTPGADRAPAPSFLRPGLPTILPQACFPVGLPCAFLADLTRSCPPHQQWRGATCRCRLQNACTCRVEKQAHKAWAFAMTSQPWYVCCFWADRPALQQKPFQERDATC